LDDFKSIIDLESIKTNRSLINGDLLVSKRGHETKKKCSNRVTAIKANCCAKGKLFICFLSAPSAHISFFANFRHISCSETAH